MLRALKAWWKRRDKDPRESPALDTPEKRDDVVKLIQSAQSNPGPGLPR
jgi:hypothetical protein